MNPMEYVIIIEPAADGTFSAYVPDLPGCVSSGETIAELQQNIEEAVRDHIEALRDTGQPVPPPSATTATVRAA
jgi:predicted RNase H-like HicB family nuclease